MNYCLTNGVKHHIINPMRRYQRYALYGNVTLKQAYCKKCKTLSFVIEGLLQCCYSPANFDSNKVKRISQPEFRRRYISKREKEEILELQEYCCLYCERKIGSLYEKRGKIFRTKINWDHLIPYCYSQNNYKHNHVLACNVCNSSKSSLMFQTVDETRIYILDRLDKRGIKFL